MRVKICGITRLEDALVAIEAGADALGFVFYPKSPRYIAPHKAREIVDALPPFVERVGLFVEESAERIDAICREARMSLAQLHWEASQELCAALQTKYLRVIRVREAADLAKYAGEVRIVDAHVAEFGGSGQRIPLEWFHNVNQSRIILAGGVNSENISEIKTFSFYGVDLSSGVERAPGIKDPVKIRQFLAQVQGVL